MRRTLGFHLAAWLMLAACGNDDGLSNNNNSDAWCGNGIVESARGEECDDGTLNSDSVADSCRTDCLQARCGDNVLDTGELCDDGNNDDGDGCSTACNSFEVCGDGVVNPMNAEDCDDGNTVSLDGCSAECRHEVLEWRDVTGPVEPEFRYQFAMAYHETAGHTVLFGGVTGTGQTNETWLFDGTQWTQASPATSPEARQNTVMAYDAQRERVVLFGGIDTVGELGDTWEWDGTTWERIMAPEWPPMRRYHAMAYDKLRGRMVLAVGQSSSADLLADTWTYDGSTWTEITPSGDHPESHAPASMGYLSDLDLIVLYLNIDPAHDYRSSFWTFDGNAWTWRENVNAQGSDAQLPIGVDDVRGVAVIPAHGLTGRTIEWDGASLTNVNTDVYPMNTNWGYCAYDSSMGTVLFHHYGTWAYGYWPSL